MEKTKLGLRVPVMGALAFVLFHFGGYVAGLIYLGYVLLFEADLELKKTALTALLAAIAFSVVNVVIGLLPDVLNVIESLLAIFTLNVHISFVDKVANLFYNILNVVKPVVMLGLAVMAWSNKPVKLAVLDKLMD